MKVFVIKANEFDKDKIENSYDDKGNFIESFYFQGSGINKNKIYFVTHGSKEGYLIIDSKKEDLEVTKKEFYYFMNGLFEYSDRLDEVDEIITIECYGGFHNPVNLKLQAKTILMRPISTQKAVLWAGWRKKFNENYFLIMSASERELYEICKNKTGYVSLNPTGDNDFQVEGLYSYIQQIFAGELFKKVYEDIKETDDYVEREFNYGK